MIVSVWFLPGIQKLLIIWTQIISSYCQAFYLNIIIRINPPLVTVSRVLARIWHVKISSMLELFLSFKHLLSHDSVVICVFHFIFMVTGYTCFISNCDFIRTIKMTVVDFICFWTSWFVTFVLNLYSNIGLGIYWNKIWNNYKSDSELY